MAYIVSSTPTLDYKASISPYTQSTNRDFYYVDNILLRDYDSHQAAINLGTIKFNDPYLAIKSDNPFDHSYDLIMAEIDSQTGIYHITADNPFPKESIIIKTSNHQSYFKYRYPNAILDRGDGINYLYTETKNYTGCLMRVAYDNINKLVVGGSMVVRVDEPEKTYDMVFGQSVFLVGGMFKEVLVIDSKIDSKHRWFVFKDRKQNIARAFSAISTYVSETQFATTMFTTNIANTTKEFDTWYTQSNNNRLRGLLVDSQSGGGVYDPVPFYNKWAVV